MTIYGGKYAIANTETKKAIAILARAEKKGLSKCGVIAMRRIEKAVVTLTSSGYMVSIQ